MSGRTKYKLRKLVIDRVDTVDDGANPESHIVLFKRNPEAPMPETDNDLIALAKTIDDEKAAAAKAAADWTTAAFAAQWLEEQAAFEAAVEAASGGDDITKRKDLPEDVRKAIEAERAESTKLAKRIEAMEIAKAKDEADAFAKAHPFLSSDEVNVADIVQKARTLDGDFADDLAKLLGLAQERIAQGEILKTKGEDGDPEKDTVAKAKAKAVELAKAKNISYGEALDEVLRAEPDLYFGADQR